MFATQAFSEQQIRKLKALKAPPKEVIAEEKEAKIKHPKPGKPLLKALKAPPKEVIAEEKEAKIKHPKPQAKRLSKQELKGKLRALPGEREKLDKAEKGFKPTSQADKKRFTLASLNPFSVPEAHAQTPVSVTLYRNNYFYNSSPYTRAYFYGLYEYSGSYYAGKGPMLVRNYNGRADLYFNVPSTGWYIINFYAYGNNRAILQHSGVTVASWNFDARPSAYEWQDYVSIQYLEAGNHYLNFRPEYNRLSYIYVNNIRVDSY